MSSSAGAKARAKEFAQHSNQSSYAQEVRENIKDLGASVGDLATHQYERAQGVAVDTLQEAGSSIRRNPWSAIGIGLGVGFLLGLMTGGDNKPGSRATS